jgi:hypothetical protein
VGRNGSGSLGRRKPNHQGCNEEQENIYKQKPVNYAKYDDELRALKFELRQKEEILGIKGDSIKHLEEKMTQ